MRRASGAARVRAGRRRSSWGWWWPRWPGSGCGLSFQALPKPGGVSGPSYNLTAVFGNVLNLPIQARVLVGADQVGDVSSITTSHFKADLTLTIRSAIRIPQGTTAQILFVDPLGDEFIQLYPPAGASHGPYLTNGSVVPERDTSSAPSIADTLAALGALLNGGGLNQLQTIVTNLNQALGGHQQQIRRIIDDLSFTVTALNANKGSSRQRAGVAGHVERAAGQGRRRHRQRHRHHRPGRRGALLGEPGLRRTS